MASFFQVFQLDLRPVGLVCGALTWLAILGTPGHAFQPPPQAPAGPTQGVAQVQDLIDILTRFDQNGRSPDQKLGFEIPEKAVNEYLAFVQSSRPRTGIGKASLTLTSKNEIAADIEIDFDALAGADDLIPENFRQVLRGRQKLRITARFTAANGFLSFTVTNASGPQGVPIPQKVIADVLQSLGRLQPESFDTSKPIPLPYGLKRVWVEKRMVCGET
jgi:hypothetical protein